MPKRVTGRLGPGKLAQFKDSDLQIDSDLRPPIPETKAILLRFETFETKCLPQQTDILFG